jgi:putative PIN family toxin of toxin-antitoxin system
VRLGVIDTGVFVAGIYWRNEPHSVLRAVALGFLRPVLTEAVFDEYVRTAWRLKEREHLERDPSPWLEAFQLSATWVSPTPFGEPICRDRKDDKFIEAALAAESCLLIARDHDLTILEKPFGISILTPRAFLAMLTRTERRQIG